MPFHDLLHVAAVVLTAVAVGVHPGWRSRLRLPRLSGCVLMLVAMVDVAYLGLLSVVVWVPALVLSAIALSALGRREQQGCVAALHDSLGLIVMAVLLPFMHPTTGPGSTAATAHAGHASAGGLLGVLTVVLVLCHVAGSLWGVARASGSAVRGQYLLMGGATALMSAAVLG
ncbi:hypothetical protein [Arthrobacter woluwensis]|uniref:hypothetical protein n=1 Tax=Arthrobacter woluwensis TaxID=156980 RepID=UPI001AAFD223|nr:hypothetical protein [Arthrobacter woluwensis]QTF70829.1 hypothetical protein G8758_01475 [Arthrobacter woluwensis]